MENREGRGGGACTASAPTGWGAPQVPKHLQFNSMQVIPLDRKSGPLLKIPRSRRCTLWLFWNGDRDLYNEKERVTAGSGHCRGVGSIPGWRGGLTDLALSQLGFVGLGVHALADLGSAQPYSTGTITPISGTDTPSHGLLMVEPELRFCTCAQLRTMISVLVSRLPFPARLGLDGHLSRSSWFFVPCH